MLPRAVVHGPVKYGGLGIIELFCEQLMAHIELVLKFSTHPKHSTGQLLQLSLEQLKVEPGVEESILSLPFDMYQPMVTPCLLTSVWSFLSKHGMRIEDSATAILLPRELDVFLTTSFVSAGLRGHDLLRLNRCRLFLQVTSLTNISTGDGLRLGRGCLRGELYPMEKQHYDWPIQGNPSSTD